MKFPTPIPVLDLAKLAKTTQIIGPTDIAAKGINEIHKVVDGDITFVDVEKYFQKALSSAASIILINKAVPAPEGKTLLVCEQPFEVYNRLVKKHRPFRPLDSRISPSAHIHPSAIIEPNVVIGAGVRIGKNCYIQSQVTIRDYTIIGDQVQIQSGTVIGADAFYFQRTETGYEKWCSGGRVVLHNKVDIGPGCTICKGVSGDTIIGEGTKIDGQVHIGHGVEIGQHCILAAQVGIGGKTIIGHGVILYGQVGIAPRLKIGDKAVILAKSGVSKNLKGHTTYFGYPAREAGLQYRSLAALRMLPDLLKKMPVLLLSLLLLLGSSSSCVKGEVKLSRADKKVKDTLVTNELKVIKPILDSLCELRRDSLVRHAVDSITAVRKLKEERLRKGSK